MSEKLISVGNGVEGVFIENSRFNTTVISYNFYLPLKKEDIAANALLPYILTSCSKEFDSFTKLSIKLNMLYGADLSASVNKTGDMHHIRFAVSVINDAFSFDKESIILQSVDLINSLIFNPRVKDGAFLAEDVEREKRKMVENILGEINDKRTYARNRAIGLMYKDLAYGLSKYGELEDVKRLDGEDIYAAWKRMLSSAYVRIQVIGEKLPNGFFETAANKFTEIDRKPTDYRTVKTLAPISAPRYTEEEMGVNQGKLVMGFSSDVSGYDEYKLNIMSDVFGGGPYSMLFENVREKMSLCYYCAASSSRIKGHLTVESGVEFDAADRAEKEILNQLATVQNGQFSDETFNASVKSLSSSLCAYNDSLEALDSWYSASIFTDCLYSPNEIAERIKRITKQDVIETAKGIKLHTVYKIVGKSGGEQ